MPFTPPHGRYRKGVGLILVNNQGLVFAGRRPYVPAKRSWQLPQGGIEEGETAEEALLREAEEEIGTAKIRVVRAASEWFFYNFPAAIQGKVWKGRYRGQQQRWFIASYEGRDEEINIHAFSREFVAWRWTTLEALVPRVIFFKRMLYEQLLQEFAADIRRISLPTKGI